MKLAIGTALFVLLASSTMYAQDQEKEKPAPKEERKQEPAAKEHPATHEQQKAQQEQQKAQEQQQKAQQHQAQEKNQTKQAEKEKSDAAKHQEQTSKQQQQQAVKQQQVAKQQQQQQQDAPQERENAQQSQRDGGNRNARHISDEEFHQHFGREHRFHVTRSEDRRFNYGGYYWVHNDPWPSDWAYTDEVYIEEVDGEYFLIDPMHPGMRLLVVLADLRPTQG